MDYPDYVFDDLVFCSGDFEPFPDDGILLPICWIDDYGHFLSIP